MTKIKFENGITVNFDGEPTPQDIEEIAAQFGKTKSDKQIAVPRSTVSKSIAGLEWLFSRGASPTAKHILAPLVEKLPISAEKKTGLEAIHETKDIRYGSDVLEQLIPGAFQHFPGEPTSLAIGKVATRITADILTDPLSYIGIGLPTKLGRLVKLVHEAALAGQSIKLDSKIGRAIAKEVGAIRPSAQAIKTFGKRIPAKTISKQITTGERSLLSVGPPLGNVGATPFPFIGTGKIAGAIVKPLSLGRRGVIGAKIEAGIRDLLSTKTGNPDYDVLYSQAKSMIDARIGKKIEDAKTLRDMRDNLSRKLELPKEELNSRINNLVEAAKSTSKKLYPKDVRAVIIDDYQDKLVDAQVALKNAHRLGDAAAVDIAAKKVVEYNSELNKITNRYKPPPSINPELDKIVNTIKERNAQQLLDDQTSGVRVTPLLADRDYAPHISTPDGRKAMVDLAVKEGRLPTKLDKKQLDEFLVNSIQRQFTEVKPIVVAAWAKAGLISKMEARIIKDKEGLNKLNQLLREERITPEQFTDAVHTLGIDEVNQLARSGKLKNMLGDYTGDLFHTDPIYYITIRGIRGEIART